MNWTIIGHVYTRQPPYNVYAKPQHGNGAWAPAIRFHEGEFYIYYPDYGIYLVKAKNPAGPWSGPLLIKEAKDWIDPCPLWDSDGNTYLANALPQDPVRPTGRRSLIFPPSGAQPSLTQNVKKSRLPFPASISTLGVI